MINASAQAAIPAGPLKAVFQVRREGSSSPSARSWPSCTQTRSPVHPALPHTLPGIGKGAACWVDLPLGSNKCALPSCRSPPPSRRRRRLAHHPPWMQAARERPALSAASVIAATAIVAVLLQLAAAHALSSLSCNPALAWRPLPPGEPGREVLDAIASKAFNVLPEAAEAPCNASEAQTSVEGCWQVGWMGWASVSCLPLPAAASCARLLTSVRDDLLQELVGTLYSLNANLTCPQASGWSMHVAAEVHAGPQEQNGTVHVLSLAHLAPNSMELTPPPKNLSGSEYTGEFAFLSVLAGWKQGAHAQSTQGSVGSACAWPCGCV